MLSFTYIKYKKTECVLVALRIVLILIRMPREYSKTRQS